MRWPSRRRSEPPRLRAAREAFLAGRKLALSSLVHMAESWCDAAVAAGNVGQAAEAHWQYVLTVVRASARQTHLEDRHRALAASGSLAAEAAYWLAEAGDPARAVRAVEHLRAVALGRLVGWSDPDSERTLRGLGRDDLLTAYAEAQTAFAVLLRDQYAGRRFEPEPLVLGEHTFGVGTGHPLDAARARVQDVERQIARALHPDGEPGPPELSALQALADRYPLVYLAAAQRTGIALVLRGRADPTVIGLPALSADALDEHAEAMRSGDADGHAEATLGWLTSWALPDLARAVAGAPLVTLVPVGRLSILPVSTALSEAVAAARPEAPPLAVRYAPNARALTRLPEAGHLPIDPHRSVLAVDAAEPAFVEGHDDLPPFRQVDAIADGLRHLYGGRLQHLGSARADAVLDGISGVEICHFTCHGVFDPEDGLKTALVLTDRALTAGELYARSVGRLRLVVLGSCETQLNDAWALDEVVSFPSAWLQAGAQGVVALQWKVDQQAAALTLRYFHTRLAAGEPPASALLTAQRWLRGATAHELTATYPDLYRRLGRARTDVVPFAGAAHWAAFSYTGR